VTTESESKSIFAESTSLVILSYPHKSSEQSETTADFIRRSDYEAKAQKKATNFSSRYEHNFFRSNVLAKNSAM